MHSLPIHQSTLGMSIHADSAVLPRYRLKRQAALFGRFQQSHSLCHLDEPALCFSHIHLLSPEVHTSPALVNFYTNQFLLFKAFPYPCQKQIFLFHYGFFCIIIPCSFRQNSEESLSYLPLLDNKAFFLHKNYEPEQAKTIHHTSTPAGVEIAREPRKYSEHALPPPGQLRQCTRLCPV